MLYAVRGFLLARGVSWKSLPNSIDAYLDALTRNAVHNGKAISELNTVYDALHLESYYQGGSSVDLVKLGFSSAKSLIQRLSGQRLAE